MSIRTNSSEPDGQQVVEEVSDTSLLALGTMGFAARTDVALAWHRRPGRSEIIVRRAKGRHGGGPSGELNGNVAPRAVPPGSEAASSIWRPSSYIAQDRPGGVLSR